MITYKPATLLRYYHHQPASTIIPQLLGSSSRCFCSSASADPGAATKMRKKKKRRDDKIAETGESVDILSSVVRWATSLPCNQDNALPPSPTTRFTFSKTQQQGLTVKSQDHTTAVLTPQQSVSASVKLLSALSCSTSPIPIVESDVLDSSNLIRKLPLTPPLSVEFSSPNIAKPLHMGHLRSTITGSFVRNVAEFAGHEVEGVCFLGDWGRQFGVLRGGVEEEIGGSDFTTFIESLSLHDLLQIYVKASNRIDGGDETLRKAALGYSAELEESFGEECETYRLWEHTRALTVDHLKSCYESLNIRFDVFEGESEFRVGSEYTDKALRLLGSSGLSERCGDGTVRVAGKDGNNVLLKADGSSVYLLRDVACALRRLERSQSGTLDPTHNSRRFVYVVDSGQSEHFKNLFELLSRLGVSRQHPSDPLPFSSTHSYVPFNRVGGMSTRSGNFVLLSQVIAEGTALMHEERARSKNARNVDDLRVSEQLAVSGLIVSSLKMRRGKGYDFDWGEALRGSGNSGVSLQYTVSRLRSLFRRVREEIGVDGGGGIGYVEGEEEMRVLFFGEHDGSVGLLVELVVCLMNFEDTFWRSYTQLEPCILVAYAFNLSDKLSRVLSSVRILDGSDRELARAALWVLGIGERVLCGCLRVVGVRVIGGDGF